MVFSMMLSFGACSGTKDAFAGIKLSESQRTWSNPDGKYKAVIEEYADDSFTGRQCPVILRITRISS